MAAKKKGLKLAPLVFTQSNTHKISQDTSQNIRYGLNEMSDEHRNTIYESIASSGIKLGNLMYSNIFTIENRPIIFVHSIEIDGVKTSIDMAFYKSTGMSRGTSLENTWLPTIGIDIVSKTIIKLEEYYVYKYCIGADRISQISNPDNKEEIDNLLTYKRFINKNNAITSYYLWNSPIDIVDPLVNVADVKHSGTYVPYIQSDVKTV